MRSFFIGIVAIAAVLIAFNSKWYVKNSHWKMNNEVANVLNTLGDSALKSNDVPVSSIIIYRNSMIAKGYNTVKRDKLAGGHAEINAITNLFRAIGIDSFNKLNRDQLYLITTWEPCNMCKGAIIEYNIQHVVCTKTKSLQHWYHQWKKIQQYEWNKQVTNFDTLQEALFKKHPQYNTEKLKGDL